MKAVFTFLAVAALVCSAGVVQADAEWNGGYGVPDHQNLTDDGSFPCGAEEGNALGFDSGMQLGADYGD